MQFKTLALAAVAFVAVANAQSFELNACSACVTTSFANDTSCSSLTPEQSALLASGFASGNPDVVKISAAVQDPSIKTCVCHWATTAFAEDGSGAAGHCFFPTTPAPPCNSSQIVEATTGIKMLSGVLSCAAGGANATTPSANGTTPTTVPSGGASVSATPKPAAAVQLNMPYVLSVAAIGLAALAGL
ncbi:hypothetical protein EC957_003995 [Mortierella hygrophila]|uniref:Secreted protein n=1 Tax=Mortierella hygrophila TaxID=979708 RepID=A0A9P6K036_9FUNG|nr:hypothetical protein EC957_003995 [Mortierella hygrophila]